VSNWEVEVTDKFTEWYDGLPDDQAEAVENVIEVLEDQGPTLKRPLVGLIETSRYRNMKELIVSVGGQELRVLFIFDPRQTAILLLGGDKAGEWTRWYQREVPRADDLYEEYLRELKEEGLLLWPVTVNGRRRARAVAAVKRMLHVVHLAQTFRKSLETTQSPLANCAARAR
jgi:hypothetical protein